MCPFPLTERVRIGAARVVKIDAFIPRYRSEGLDPVLATGEGHLLARTHLIEHSRRRLGRIAVLGGIGNRRDPQPPVLHFLENGALGQLARNELKIELFGECVAAEGILRVLHDEAQVACHGNCGVGNFELGLFVVPLGQTVSVFENSPRIVGEPKAHPCLKQEAGEDRHQQRRHGRDQREKEHQTLVKMCRRSCGAAHGQPAAQQHQQRHRRDQRANEEERRPARRDQLVFVERAGEIHPARDCHPDQRDGGYHFENCKNVGQSRSHQRTAQPSRRTSWSGRTFRVWRFCHSCADTTILLPLCKQFSAPAPISR